MSKVPDHYPEAVRSCLRFLEGNAMHQLGWYERFTRLLDLWFYGFRRMEKEYMATVKAMGNDAVREAAELCGEMLHAMRDEPCDLLGKVYQTYAAHDKRLGQYFTPDTVASAMAKMSLVDMRPETFSKKGGAVIGEPTVGSGVMAIHGLLAVHEEFGDWGTSRTHVVATDLDYVCCQMTALQLLWLSAAQFPVGLVTVMHGDSLTQQAKRLCWFGAGLPSTTRKMKRVRT